MPVRFCRVSFADVRGIRHSADVEAESLYEAAILGIRRLNQDPWVERIGPATLLEVEVGEPSTLHTISLQQIERWLGAATTNPNEASKKAKLKFAGSSLATFPVGHSYNATLDIASRLQRRYNEAGAANASLMTEIVDTIRSAAASAGVTISDDPLQFLQTASENAAFKSSLQNQLSQFAAARGLAFEPEVSAPSSSVRRLSSTLSRTKRH